MSKLTPQKINEAFLAVWEEFGDNKSTEFIAQVTAERLKISASRVYDALQAVAVASDGKGGTR